MIVSCWKLTLLLVLSSHFIVTSLHAFLVKKRATVWNLSANNSCNSRSSRQKHVTANISRRHTSNRRFTLICKKQSLLKMSPDGGNKLENDYFKDEFEKLKMNLNDELKELTFTIDELQKRKQKKKLKPTVATLQNILVCINVAFFIYQVLTVLVRPTTPRWYSTSRKNKTLLPNILLSPLTADFMFMGSLASKGRQPHRYITSSFLHGGIIHLVLNMRSLYKTPAWLEAGLGKPLYITVYLVSTVAANICHATFYGSNIPAIGSSGAICGLLGYEYMVWRKMKRNLHSNHIIQNMIQMVLVGALIPCVSNASHIGGFAAGSLLGWILGPTFSKSYAAKRDRLNARTDNKNNTPVPAALQRVMGVDLVRNPSKLSLKLFWIATLLICANNTSTRRIPELIIKGIIHPGSLGKRF